MLDNAGWFALTSKHARFAEGQGSARRYEPDVTVFSAMTDDSPDSWSDLGELIGTGNRAVLFRAKKVIAPPGWRVVFGGRGHQMILIGSLPDVEIPATLRPLSNGDVPAMLELVELSKPGPFAPRTIELGGYLGIFEDDRLLAMAGRRIAVDGFTEISAVCTHPDARRRGLAGIVTKAVAMSLLDEGITPFLHVAETNVGAFHVYERLGFVPRLFTHFVAVERTE